MRLDVFITERALAESRTQAKSFIESGCVTVGGVVIKKASYEVSPDTDTVFVDTSSKKYVSRGGLKREGALDYFGIAVDGLSALDVGASSGGFTDCLLKRGASRVIAVDSGTGQMVKSLLEDERVTSLEKFNAKLMTPDMLPYVPEIAVMDVSFISAKLIIPAVFACLSDGGDFVCLIKPQFEVGKGGIGKGGIVKDSKLRDKAVKDVADFGVSCGFSLIGVTESPIKGGDGNTEFLAYFKKIRGTINEKHSSHSQS